MVHFQIEDLSFAYPTAKEKKTLENVNLTIEKGAYIVLCGASGSGKTTLLRQLKSVLAPHGKKEGRILFNGVPLEQVSQQEQAAKIGYVMQNPEEQIVTDKVWHELAFGLESLGFDQTTMRARVAEMACYFGIQDWFHKDVETLSGGQKQLLNLASIMAMQPEVLILDEPTSQLDPLAASDFLNTVRKINTELGTTVIITEHRLEDIFPYADRAIVMDGGKILADTTISTVGSYGYWVETPADVTPIVVSDTDRYKKYPSLLFDFEDMSVGAFNRSSHSPKDTWDFSGTGAAAIEKIGNDQVLTLRGDITLYSKKLPGNITAGDSYAEDQCWQVTLTIPEGLPADAEITLLAYYSSSQSAADEGFKIAGGKVYYSTGTTAQEFKELCAITPGTYVLERTMDLNDPADFKSTYALYKSDGTKLASSGKVSIPTYTTIGSIRFGTGNLEQAAVQLDDYKIFLTGLTTDFMLFDAQLGMPISAQDTPRDRSTAYRLSWLNATDKEVAAGVMAAIYRGETLVEEKVVKLITMAPGCDGVDTGEVALEDGQTLKVYLKTGSLPTPPNLPNPLRPPNPPNPATGRKAPM